jgi:hypothetical protein
MDMIAGAKAITTEQTRWLDLGMEFMPADKHRWCAGGCAKTPLEIYLECAGIYRFMAQFLQGKQTDESEIHPKPEAYPDYASAKALMTQCQEELFAELDNLENPDWEKKLTLPWGDEMTLGELIYLPAFHSGYHVGQLNYIQTLLGDKEFHF